MSTSASASVSTSVSQKRPLVSEFVYDQYGNPVANTITVDLSTIRSIYDDDLKCPICLETIEVTWAVSSCLHRFCSECIHKSLRMALGPKMHHECPFCRVKLASRRSSRPDPAFDQLIKLFAQSRKRKPSNDDSFNYFECEDETEHTAFDIQRYRHAHLEKVRHLQQAGASIKAALNIPSTSSLSKRKFELSSCVVHFGIFPCPEVRTHHLLNYCDVCMLVMSV
jgi:hypothetical protein